MAWWDNAGTQQWDDAWWTAPVEQWSHPGVAGEPIAATRFSQFDAGGDFDTNNIPGIQYQDYLNFVDTYLGGDAANFGQPGYEEGTNFLTAQRVAPQATTSPYQQVTLADGTRYYGNQQAAQKQAFRQNNPVTAAQVPVGQSQRLLDQQQALAAPQRRVVAPPSARRGPGRLGGY